MMDKKWIAVVRSVDRRGITSRKLFMAGAAVGLFFTGAPAHSNDFCPVSYSTLKTQLTTAANAD